MMTANGSTLSDTAADVAALLRARNPLIWIVSREEARVERQLIGAVELARYVPVFWDCVSGTTKFGGEPINSNLSPPVAALNELRGTDSRQVWIFRDLPIWFRDPVVLRGARNLARTLPQAPREKARAMIIISPSGDIPAELSGHAVVIEWPLPDRDEIAQILDSSIDALPDDVRAEALPKNGAREAAIDAAVGLTDEEARGCYAKSLVAGRKIDPVVVAAEKRRVITRERVLEWFDPIPGGLDAVGGLDELKGWLERRKVAFSQAAREYGLPAPKGVLLVGVSGCGKSLTAKAVATAWGMPLLRLDLGALKSKWVGESEGNVRKALKVAETVAPCVVWMDEIEKALAGGVQGAADGGVSSDALGTILSWMQDRAGSVFVVATANDVTKMPPELLRKGRFDDLFFVDLPQRAERVGVLEAALRAHGRAQHSVDVAKVAEATQGFTGAELAALVPEALFAAFADEAREITTEDLEEAAKRTVPLSQTAADKIKALREWAKESARPASTPEAEVAAGMGVELDI